MVTHPGGGGVFPYTGYIGMCRGIGSKFAFPYMWTTKIDCVTKGEEEVFNLNPRAFPLERSWKGAMPFIAWVLA